MLEKLTGGADVGHRLEHQIRCRAPKETLATCFEAHVSLYVCHFRCGFTSQRGACHSYTGGTVLLFVGETFVTLFFL